MHSVTDMLKINDLICCHQARMDPYGGKLVLTRYRSMYLGSQGKLCNLTTHHTIFTLN